MKLFNACYQESLLCLLQSSTSYGAGDASTGAKQGRWALIFNICAIIAFVVFFIIIVALSAV